MDANIIGERIRDERLKKKMTQEQLGVLMNVTKQTVSNWENGNRMPEIPTLYKLADLFFVSSDYLMGKTEDSTFDLEMKKNIIREEVGEGVHLIFKDVKDVTPEQLRIIRAVLEKEKK